MLIERFLHDHRIDVGGRVLEVTDAGYSHRFGEDRLKHATVLDIDRTNERATLIADLGVPDSLPANAFDCIILTQTLHIISNDEVTCRNLWRSLTPGGVLLLTAPVVSGLRMNNAADYWRYTPMGLARLLAQTCDWADLEVTGRGNVLLCAAFLLGMAGEELSAKELALDDAQFPLLVTARARKPG